MVQPCFFPSTYNLTERSDLYKWRDEARTVLLNAGFENFRDLYNGNVSDAAEWDRTQLKSEQAALQPIHEKYLSDRDVFNWLTRKLTDSNVEFNIGIAPGADKKQTTPGGIDMLNENSRVNFGCELTGQNNAGCKR